MSSTLSPALRKTLEAAEYTYVRLTLTRYACGESLESFGLFVSPLTAVLAIGMTILCYDALLTFSDEVWEDLSFKAAWPSVTLRQDDVINPRLVDRCD
jgi:hypothetical protein